VVLVGCLMQSEIVIACNFIKIHQQQLSEKAAEKCRKPSASVMTYIRTNLKFALLRRTLATKQGLNVTMFTSRISQTLTSDYYLGPQSCTVELWWH